MKTIINLLFTLVFSFSALLVVNSQDIIVTKKGTVINCRIQNEDSVRFNIIVNKYGNEVETYMNKSDIQSVKYGIRLSKSESLAALENPYKKKWNLELGTGINFLGPTVQMEDLMVKNAFNSSASSWLGTFKYPRSDNVGISAQMSFSRILSPRSKLGILLYFSYLSQVKGRAIYDKYLSVGFRNFSIIPLYKIELNKYWGIQAGPAIMINSGNKIIGSADVEKYTKLSAGLLTGLFLKIWNREITYGRFGANYMFTTGKKMGPYTADKYTNDLIPESIINFSHMNLILILGINL